MRSISDFSADYISICLGLGDRLMLGEGALKPPSIRNMPSKLMAETHPFGGPTIKKNRTRTFMDLHFFHRSFIFTKLLNKNLLYCGGGGSRENDIRRLFHSGSVVVAHICLLIRPRISSIRANLRTQPILEDAWLGFMPRVRKKGKLRRDFEEKQPFCTPPLPLLDQLVLVVFVMIPKGRREGSGHEHVAQAVGGHLQDPQQLAAHLEHDGALAGRVDVPTRAIKPR